MIRGIFLALNYVNVNIETSCVSDASYNAREASMPLDFIVSEFREAQERN
jgi:hypothetical protein